MAKRLFVTSILSMFVVACCLSAACSCLAEKADYDELNALAEDLKKKIDPFYTNHVVVDGILVTGSDKVSKRALSEVGYLAKKMLANRPDVVVDLCKNRRMFVAVMAYTELQSDLPECKGMGDWWDFRARGLGSRPPSCGEENVLQFKGDPWAGENIFIHEFGHVIQGHVGKGIENFNERMKGMHAKAEASGRFRGYGISGGPGEFWAEGVQAYFNCNGTIRPKSGGGQSSFEAVDGNGEHVCHIQTREQLKKYLPEFFKLVDEAFGQNPWVYTPVAERLDEPHLQGFDPAKAPEFRWPEGLEEKFYKLEAERLKKQKR